MSDFQPLPTESTEAVKAAGPDYWNKLWRNSSIPEQLDQKALWRLHTSRITQTPELAERLVAHGWTPADFERALTETLHLDTLHQDAVWPQAKAAFIILSDAVGRIHESRRNSALELRRQAMIDLAQPILDANEEVLQKGWSYGKIGALIGLTKQRVQQLGKPLRINDSSAVNRSGRIATQTPRDNPQS